MDLAILSPLPLSLKAKPILRKKTSVNSQSKKLWIALLATRRNQEEIEGAMVAL